MLGACAGCTMIDETLKDGVEQILMEEVPGVLEVQNIFHFCKLLFYLLSISYKSYHILYFFLIKYNTYA